MCSWSSDIWDNLTLSILISCSLFFLYNAVLQTIAYVVIHTWTVFFYKLSIFLRSRRFLFVRYFVLFRLLFTFFSSVKKKYNVCRKLFCLRSVTVFSSHQHKMYRCTVAYARHNVQLKMFISQAPIFFLFECHIGTYKKFTTYTQMFKTHPISKCWTILNPEKIPNTHYLSDDRARVFFSVNDTPAEISISIYDLNKNKTKNWPLNEWIKNRKRRYKKK